MSIEKASQAIMAWQSNRQTTFTPSDILSEFGDVILNGLECWFIIDQLRAPEGAQVTLICDNPDFNMGPNSGVEIVDDWTGWKCRRFDGDSVLDALRAAKAAHDAHVEIEKARVPPGSPAGRYGSYTDQD